MSNIKFTSTGPTTICLSGNGLSNSFYANNSAYTLGTIINLADGETVQFYGTGTEFSKDASHFYQFVIGGTGTVTVEGDLISLTNNTAVKQYQFMKLFAGCDKITSIANLVFPASIADWCYANMFMDCTGLVNAGTTLPATAASRWCYQGMFARCTSLTTPPTISSTKLAPFCYYGMFTGCISLVQGPELKNAVVEGDFSNNIMFKGCSSLSTITVDFADWPSGNWSRKWLDGVAETGLFVKSIALTSYPQDAIPANWSLSTFYPAQISVDSETFSFDAMSDTSQTKEFSYSYDGTQTVNINVDTTNKPSWLSYTTDNNSVDFVANGYAIDSSTSFQIPITFSAADAETKSAVATFNISNYPTATITVSTIPTFTFDKQSETDIVSSLMTYATGSNSISCQIEGELPAGLSCVNGVITGIPSQFTSNFDDSFNVIYSASDARTVISSVQVEIVNAIDPDLIWYMDFSNGLIQPNSNIEGTKVGTNAGTYFNIQTDSTMGTYLHCTKNNTSYNTYVTWPGSKDYLNNLLENTNPLTLSYWMYSPNPFSVSHQSPFATINGDLQNGIYNVLYKNEQKLFFAISAKGEVNTLRTTVDWSVWNHWVFVKDSTGGHLYLNGNLIKTEAGQANAIAKNNIDITIGIKYNSWNQNLLANFDITKYRYYKRALTASEILALYTNKL